MSIVLIFIFSIIQKILLISKCKNNIQNTKSTDVFIFGRLYMIYILKLNNELREALNIIWSKVASDHTDLLFTF